MSSGGGGERHETLILRLDVGHESILLVLNPETAMPLQHTHKWTVFVRGQNETPLDPNLIQKVVFTLHDSFPNPKRVVSRPPFEVTETGYGGFVILIFIHFAHSKEPHYIEYDMNLTYEANHKNKETKVIEFKDPEPKLRARLLKAGAEISSNKSTKAQAGGSSFQDLFGETLLASPSTSNEKPKLSAPVPNVKRQSASPPSNGPSIKPKHLSVGKPSKPNFSASSAISQAQSPQESEKKRRKSKDSNRSTSNKSGGKHAPYGNYDADNHRPIGNQSSETNGAAQCLLDAPKVPPFVSPLSDGAYGAGSIFPSTSSACRDEQKNDDIIDSEQYKSKKLANKFRQKGAEKSTGISSATNNSKRRVQNGGIMEDKGKRKKTKSDSGLDSDYSSGMPNAHSPVVANGQHSVGVNDTHGAGNALFSPPDSVRSLDTLQESPASAASSSSSSSSSGGSSTSSTSRPRRHNGCDDDLATVASSSTGSSTDQGRWRQLRLLQQKIMTIKEKRVAQRVVDVISTQSSFELTTECLEFDLCALDSDLIQRLLQIFDLQV